MREFKHIDNFLDALRGDIYDQPTDPGHESWTRDVLAKFMPEVLLRGTVLDVGCGDGFSRIPFMNEYGFQVWIGITLDDKDIKRGTEHHRDIRKIDFSFTPFEDQTFDLIFARHALEHSPMPLLTLMEWHRICAKYLLVVLPAPDYWGEYGKNHYFVMPKQNWWCLFDRAGFKVVQEQDFTTLSSVFMDSYRPEEENRKLVKFHDRPKIVEYRYLLERK